MEHAVTECLVLPENWKSVCLFQACSSQFDISPWGKVLGIPYDKAEIVIKRGGYEPLSTEDWERFQILERVATNELNR